jgi:glycosyltransferase involved in cell wall biosynthesis
MDNNRVLVIFHLNFLKLDRGCSYAIYVPIKMLKTLGYTIDFFTTNEMDDFSDFANYNNENLIENLFLVNMRKEPPLSMKTNKKNNGIFYSLKRLLKYFHLNKPYHYVRKIIKDTVMHIIKLPTYFFSKNYCLGSFVSDNVLEKFQEVIKKNRYNFIYVHYIEWADLFRYTNIPLETKLIYHMQDSHFVQYSYLNNNIKLISKVLEEELKSLNFFHVYLYLSFDELLFWTKFSPNKKHYFFPPITSLKELPEAKKTIDILCLGHNNPYNVKSIYWFLDEVYPLLHKDISITFCGRFISALQSDYLDKIYEYNISIIDFIDNLEELYAKTKIVIVPIQGGTGIKIKTIEALSYSIPVVSTFLGVDGFPDKFENGCQVSNNPNVFANNIKKLLEDEVFYISVKNRQNEYYKKHFSFEQNIETLKNVFINDNE